MRGIQSYAMILVALSGDNAKVSCAPFIGNCFLSYIKLSTSLKYDPIWYMMHEHLGLANYFSGYILSNLILCLRIATIKLAIMCS